MSRMEDRRSATRVAVPVLASAAALASSRTPAAMAKLQATTTTSQMAGELAPLTN